MTFEALTLASFFANDRGADASDCFDAGPILSEIAAQAHNVPRDGLLSVNGQFGGCVSQMLDVQLGDIFGAAHVNYSVASGTPSETVTVTLGSNTTVGDASGGADRFHEDERNDHDHRSFVGRADSFPDLQHSNRLWQSDHQRRQRSR